MVEEWYLQNHEQRSGRNQNAADETFRSEFFMEKHKREHQRNDDAQLINWYDLGCVTNLKRFVITEPGSPRRKSGENQKQPAS